MTQIVLPTEPFLVSIRHPFNAIVFWHDLGLQFDKFPYTSPQRFDRSFEFVHGDGEAIDLSVGSHLNAYQRTKRDSTDVLGLTKRKGS